MTERENTTGSACGETAENESPALQEAYRLLNEFADDSGEKNDTAPAAPDDGKNEFDVFGRFDEYGAADDGPGFIAADSVDTDGMFGFEHEYGDDEPDSDDDDEFDIF
jgi:hypothetical protein